ncbi:MAG: 5-(carboxyamino)imidazole ribonucleotide mutase [Candidatus Omnitrophica bacterium]|nr:5-(carboxyamino)imidazole ribonucleotide mutase [Candidatus Omnitrophota bacterium]
MATKKKPVVSIVMGSDSDAPHLKDAVAVLEEFGIGYEVRVLSAHRTPDEAARYAKGARKRGINVIIAAAGGAAHLPGVLGSLTGIPVIGVPMMTRAFKGIDSLLSILQMPKGIPVATMAVGSAGGRNAALYAVRILALTDRRIETRLGRHIKDMAQQVLSKDRRVKRQFA